VIYLKLHCYPGNYIP